MRIKSLGLLLGVLTSLNAAQPALRFSTFIAGARTDFPLAIASDPSGFIYVAGYTDSSDLPALNTLNGGSAFVQKLSPDGSSVIYTSLLNDCMPRAITVNGLGEAFIVGQTYSPEDAVLFKMNAAGNQIVFRKTIGGAQSDTALDVAVDPATGKVWLTGATYSTDFPTAGQPYQNVRAGSFDGFLARYSADGSTLEYSTFLGGPEGPSLAYGLALDSQGRPIVCGWTAAAQFPAVNPINTFGGVIDAFLSRFDITGETLLSSTFLGGDFSDLATKCALDSNGNIYVTGFTSSTNFPTQNPAQPELAGGADAFVMKLNPEASAILYSTYLGSSLDDWQLGWPNLFGPDNLSLNTGGIAVSPEGRALVVGSTFGSDFPKVDSLKSGHDDYFIGAFAALFEPDGAISFSSLLGGANSDSGLAVARAGNAFVVTGATSPGVRLPNFPRTPGASQGFSLNSTDGFVMKLDTLSPPLVNDSFANPAIIEGLESTLLIQTGAATKEANEPNHPNNSGGKSVWFKWTPPADGRVTVTTRGSSFSTLLQVFRGTILGDLQLAGASGSEVRVNAIAGQPLSIVADGLDGASGNLFLSLSLSLAPNDDFANRLPLVGANATATGSNIGSTSEPGETGQRTIWWKWVAPTTGAYTFTTLGTSFPSWLATFSGDSIQNLQFITDNLYYTNANARLTIKAEAGVEYQIQIAGDGGATGDVTLTVFPATRPANDDFANRIRLGNRNELVSGNDFDAAFEPAEFALQNSVGLLYGSGRIVWWEWTSPIDGAVEITTTNSVRQFVGGPVATKMIIFPGETFPPATSTVIVAYDAAERLPAAVYITEVRAGTKYQIGLDSPPWEQPVLFSLKIRAIAPPKIIATSVQIDATRTFRARVEGIEGKSYRVVASTNLVAWDPISSHPAIPGEFAFETAVGAGYRFFRIEEVP